MRIKFTALLVSTFFFVSCAHEPTKGDEMLDASDHAKALSSQWEQGHQLTSAGNAKHRKGLDLIAKGNSLTHAGKAQVKRGKRLQEESETDFDNKFTNPPLPQ